MLIKSKLRIEKLIPYLFILPFILSFFIFFLFPAVYSFILSFYRYRGYGNATFIGFQNYISLFKYPFFWTSMKNTMFYFIIHIIPTMMISFLLALVLQSRYVVFKKLCKSLIFMPQVMAVVTSALVWRVILSTRTGVISTMLNREIQFLQDPLLMKLSVAVLITWRSIGWFMVVFIAGLTTISYEILESAIIDGANFLKRMLHIVIPLMKPIFLLAFIIETIGSLRVAVEPNLLISGQLDAPVHAAPVLNIIVNNIKGGNFGMASATGWILFMIILALSLLQYKILNER